MAVPYLVLFNFGRHKNMMLGSVNKASNGDSRE